MSKRRKKRTHAEKRSVTLPGHVEKIVPAIPPVVPEKAQIAVEGADHLYREIRIDNELSDEQGKQVKLKPGAEVDVTIEADAEGTDSVTTDNDDAHRKDRNA